MVSDPFGLINVGGEAFSLIIKLTAILVVTLIAAKVIGRFLGDFFKQTSKNVKIDKTQFIILQRLIALTIYISGFTVAASLIPGFSALGISLLASAGILAVVVGFAAQQAFSNIISGVFIGIFEPFKVGDKISIQGDYGEVEDITLRHTVIRTWEEKRIVIPNSKISEESIVNFTTRDPKVLGILEIGISYDSDVEKARKIMTKEAFKHPDLLRKVRGPDNAFLSKEELVRVRLVELTDFAQLMRLYFWAPDKTTAIKMKFDLTESIKKSFDKEGIEIPFPYHTIVYKKDMEKKKK